MGAIAAADTIGTRAPSLAATGLVKRFGGIAALDGADLEVARGSLSALIGPNGAGKSTLFNVVCGVVEPDAGSVRIDGTDVTGRRSPSWRVQGWRVRSRRRGASRR